MTDNHSITPPPELVQRWMNEDTGRATASDVATQAARWGWDQRNSTVEAELQQARNEKLKACYEWLREAKNHGFGYECGAMLADGLYIALRFKPPSLKKQALEALGPEPPPENSPTGDSYLNGGAIERHRTIRRALEILPE